MIDPGRTRPSALAFALLGTAGLLADPGAAGADGIEVLTSGQLKFGVTTAEDERLSDGEGDRGYQFFTDSELYIEANVSPSATLEIGAEVVIEVDADVDEVNADETFMFISGGFGLMQLGRTEGAEDAMALGADTIAAGTGGLDGDTENLGETQIVNSGDATKISYFTPRAAGVQFGISFTPDTGDNEGGSNDLDNDLDDDDDSEDELEDLENHIGIGLNLLEEIGDVEIGLAVVGSYGNSEETGRNDLDAFSVGGILALDEIEIGISYGETKAADDFDFATLGATVGFDQASAGIGYNYLDEKADGITHIIALSGDLAVLEGVELQADVSYANPKLSSSNIASVLALELSF